MFKKISAKFASYAASLRGATAIEYGLIAAGIALAIVVTVFVFGQDLFGHYDSVHSGFVDNGAGGGD